MPNPLNATFVTGSNALTWSFTTEARPNLVWSFTTTNKGLEWSFTTETGDLVWSFTTAQPLVWSFTTADRDNLVWSFTTAGASLEWSFTTVEDNPAQIGEFVGWARTVDGSCKTLRVGVRLAGNATNPTYKLTNLRTGASITGTFSGTQQNFGFTFNKDKDGVYELWVQEGSSVVGYGRLLIDCENCFYTIAVKEESKGGLCTNCGDLSQMRALTNIYKNAFEKGDYKLVHEMMDILDDVCTDCETC